MNVNYISTHWNLANFPVLTNEVLRVRTSLQMENDKSRLKSKVETVSDQKQAQQR